MASRVQKDPAYKSFTINVAFLPRSLPNVSAFWMSRETSRLPSDHGKP